MNPVSPHERRWQKWLSLGFGIFSAIVIAGYLIFLLINRAYMVLSVGQLTRHLVAISTLCFLAVLLSYRRPDNRISWLFVVVAFIRLIGFVNLSVGILLNKGVEPTFWLLFFSNLWVWLSALTFTILAFAIVLFPTGQLPSQRWRAAVWLLGLQIILTAGEILYMNIDLIKEFAAIEVGAGKVSLIALSGEGPGSALLHTRPLPEIIPIINAIALTALAMVVLGLLSQLSRFQFGDRVERQQVKWVILMLVIWAFGIALVFVLKALSFSVLLYFEPFIPIAIAVAILRYRLFDIDLIIRRTLVYGVLTGLLVIVYFGTVTLLQAVVTALTGQTSPIIIVVSTLVIAALFSPLRRRIQQAIDRRFYRRKYDAERILAKFAATARDEVDLENLTAELLYVTQESLQPETVSIWFSPQPSGSTREKS